LPARRGPVTTTAGKCRAASSNTPANLLWIYCIWEI